MPCERRSLEGADRKALVAECVDRLRAGELCVLPTETVYGLTVLPSHAAAVERARALKGRPTGQPFTWHISRREDLHALCAAVPPPARRLIERYWPGPLTLVLAGRDGGTVGLRQPAHPFAREVIAACGEPLWLSSVNASGEPPLGDADAICARYGDQLAMVVDDGAPALGISSTIVRATGPRLEVLREGILSRDEVLYAAADLVLFVCTGNTCRSPLAEALARDLAARQLGCDTDEVLAHGLAFASLGTMTMDGMPASDGSREAALELGIDLSDHRSHALNAVLLEQARYIYCLGNGHRQALLAEFPQVGDKISLLRSDQNDIEDPYGGPIELYRKVRDEIRAAVGARLPEWLPKPASD